LLIDANIVFTMLANALITRSFGSISLD